MCALDINRPQEAVEQFTPIDPEGPILKGWFQFYDRLTMAHHMLGSHNKELKEARRGKRQYPDKVQMLRCEIRALAAMGKIQDVYRVLNECLDLPQGERNYARLVLKAGLVLKLKGYRDASLQVLERGIKWLEDRPEKVSKSLGHRYNLARLFYTAERWEEAQILFEALHSEDPDFYDVIGFLGSLAARRGDRDKALKFSGLLENDKRPYHKGWYTYCRANIAALLGEKELAVRLLREAHSQGVDFIFFIAHDQPNVMDFEPLYDYPPFQEFMKPKG
jgi:tetratricopeptide (TPR) repeat protein